jgi:hypothetical protein
VDRRLSDLPDYSGVLFFKLYRTQITQSRVSSLTVVENLNVFKDRLAGFESRGEAFLVHKFRFDG